MHVWVEFLLHLQFWPAGVTSVWRFERFRGFYDSTYSWFESFEMVEHIQSLICLVALSAGYISKWRLEGDLFDVNQALNYSYQLFLKTQKQGLL